MVSAECPFCCSRMDLTSKEGMIMNVPVKALYWACSEKECGMELIHNYDKVKRQFMENLDTEAIHVEDFLIEELNVYLRKLRQKEKILGFHNERSSPYTKAIDEAQDSIDRLKEVNAAIELNRILLRNPKTLIPDKVTGYGFKDKLKIFLGFV